MFLLATPVKLCCNLKPKAFMYFAFPQSFNQNLLKTSADFVQFGTTVDCCGHTNVYYNGSVIDTLQSATFP